MTLQMKSTQKAELLKTVMRRLGKDEDDEVVRVLLFERIYELHELTYYLSWQEFEDLWVPGSNKAGDQESWLIAESSVDFLRRIRLFYEQRSTTGNPLDNNMVAAWDDATVTEFDHFCNSNSGQRDGPTALGSSDEKEICALSGEWMSDDELLIPSAAVFVVMPMVSEPPELLLPTKPLLLLTETVSSRAVPLLPTEWQLLPTRMQVLLAVPLLSNAIEQAAAAVWGVTEWGVARQACAVACAPANNCVDDGGSGRVAVCHDGAAGNRVVPSTTSTSGATTTKSIPISHDTSDKKSSEG